MAALAFAGCYVLGASAGLVTASLFSRTALKGRALPMILELPPYRVPSVWNALLTARDQGLSFLRSAGSIIMAICIVMWWLSAYPRLDRAAEMSETAHARAQQTASYAGQFGRLVQPVFAPLGFDWQLTVGVVTSFAAREVFVSTMSVLEGGRDVDGGVVERIRGMTRDDGGAVFTPSVAAAALIFFVLAMQCLPTLAMTRKETGSWKYAALQLGYMSGLAYAAALAARTVLLMVGVS
jgi:ferrous iron transport protein B